MLLPARTAQEASAWGNAASEYAAAFDTVHFSRDPGQVDWRGYQHVTVVRPAHWSDDLPALIKQANAGMGLDLIDVDTPEALQFVLHVRIYYGWRYGPQTQYDWAKVWPAGQALVGAHGRATGELDAPDFAVVRAARLEAVKLTSHATPATVRQLRAINPDMFILVRPMVSFAPAESPRQVSADEFYEWTVNDLARLLDADRSVRYVEIHNEPNTRFEGLGGSWGNGREFGEWFLAVLRRYRRRFPNALFGFPGLSPGSAAWDRAAAERFLDEAAFAAQQADWVGLHAYWVSEREMVDQALGLSFARYRERFPEKLLFITEFGNPAQKKTVVADQYARYYGLLRNVPGLGAAFAYILSTPDPAESPRWAWRDEAGADLGIAGAVGRREFVH